MSRKQAKIKKEPKSVALRIMVTVREHGLIFAALSAWRRFLIWAKYWELVTTHKDVGRV